MLELNTDPSSSPRRQPSAGPRALPVALAHAGARNLEARVKPDCTHLYPRVDPGTWYRVLQEGEYKDEMEGLWIQVSDWVTYVLAKHFDLQSRTTPN